MGGFPNAMAMQGGGDSGGLASELAKRKNGLTQALLAIPEDQQAQPSAEAPKLDRVEDDKTPHPQGQPTLAERMNAGDYSALAVGSGAAQPPQDDHLNELQAQYGKLGQRSPMKLWQKIALGLSAPFGGLKNFADERNLEDQRRTGERGKLLSEIEAERRMQQQEQLGTQRMTLQEQLQAEREKSAQEAQERLFGQQAQMAQPEHLDTDQGPIQFNRQTKQWEPIMVGGQRVGAKAQPKPDTLEQQYDSAVSSGDRVTAKRLLGEMQAMGAAKQPPQRDPRQLAIGPDGTVLELKPGMTVPQGTMTPSAELGKPNADEQRRADLAENMNENLNQLEEIVKRRGDLFGPHGAGLLTSLRGMVGTGDPDIARLKAIKEYLGMASVGAHAMRNAQHVATAADAVMAGFRNSPEAMLAAIGEARNSTATFKKDIERSRGVGGPAQPSTKPAGGVKLKDRAAVRILVEGKDF